jgi:uncharacterized membrane protein YidH (DUF202 family)
MIGQVVFLVISALSVLTFVIGIGVSLSIGGYAYLFRTTITEERKQKLMSRQHDFLFIAFWGLVAIAFIMMFLAATLGMK